MVPLPEIDQLYVAPLTAVTEAVLPVERAQTDDGAVIVQSGGWLMGTVTPVLVQEQPAALVTEIPRVTLPLAPAVKVMELVPSPPVMMPLVMDQV